jgi:hypothetical protein
MLMTASAAIGAHTLEPSALANAAISASMDHPSGVSPEIA